MSGYPTGIGDYEIRGTLGTGMSGTVFLAHQSFMDRDVALKQLSATLTAQPEFRERFRGEAEIMARLDNEHCVRVFDYFEREDHAYLVTELIAGVSLRKLVENGGLSPEQALGVLKGALLGLEHAHELGLVHRDIKPENILLDIEGTSKLADFGLAGTIEGPGAAGGMPSGSPSYMSPETVSGFAGDARSDLYSAGAVLFELLTGRPPFVGEGALAVMRMQRNSPVPNPHDHNGHLGPEVTGLVMGSLAKDPGDRPQTAAQMLAALESAATQAYGPEWETRASVKKEVAAAIGAGLGLLAMLGVAGAAAAAAAVGSAVTASAAATMGAATATGSGGVLGMSTWLIAAGIAGLVVLGAGGYALANGVFSGRHTAGSAVVVSSPSPTPTEVLTPTPEASASPSEVPGATPSPSAGPSASPSASTPVTAARRLPTPTPTTTTTTPVVKPGPITVTSMGLFVEKCNTAGGNCAGIKSTLADKPDDASPYTNASPYGYGCDGATLKIFDQYTWSYAGPTGTGSPTYLTWSGTEKGAGGATVSVSGSRTDSVYSGTSKTQTAGTAAPLVIPKAAPPSGTKYHVTYTMDWTNPNDGSHKIQPAPVTFYWTCI
ncbi:MAG: eukaryotic-like serine/threonine-protein kinase [Chloroflexota bacterium]|jgi:serine/threonine-protein kinase|nr:eukaryotic-like serine/threonine-protein kinase [Chloroflexota bacterium]